MTQFCQEYDFIKPFLKWPGGKRWLVPYIRNLLGGREFRRYFEPFLGGGALFFGLKARNAILSDVNGDLVNTYMQVKWRPLELIQKIKGIPVNKETFLILRREIPKFKIDQAIRFLYLNRTSFGGLYRVNKEGEFNVPFAGGNRRPDSLWRDNLIMNASKLLRQAKIITSDFEEPIEKAGKGDLVYCDPTYTVSHNNNGFIRYNERNFSWSDQERLAKICQAANQRGATVLVSNAFHHRVAKLYPSAKIHILDRKTRLCPDIEKRGNIQEYLFALWPKI